MTNNIIQKMTGHNIHCYGSAELLKFEKQMTRYFEREYERWHGNNISRKVITPALLKATL